MSSKTNNAIKANKAKSVIYQQAKSLGLPVWWQMHASRIQDILNNHQRQVAAQTKIASMIKSSKAKSQLNDLKALKRINKFQTTTILLDSFKRIRPNIVAPADKNVLFISLTKMVRRSERITSTLIKLASMSSISRKRTSIRVVRTLI
ncbi:unnamed protein product [Aphanomyces euteiches]